MHEAQWVLIGCGVLVLGAVVTAEASSHRRWVGRLSFFFTLTSGAIVFAAALRALLHQTSTSTAPLMKVPPLGATLVFRVDPLSAFFLLLISAISVLAALYSIRYMDRYHDQHLGRYYPPLLLFFAGMMAVVCTDDWFFFLVFWEFMTICSYLLVIFERENIQSQRAGFKYIVITHAATALMLIAVIAVWRTSHSLSFAATGPALSKLAVTQPALLHVLLAFWFIGLATKVGILPFGDWLPDAHPAAPSGVSAVLSGVMVKLGVYGLLRVFLEMLTAPGFGQVWGIVIAVMGTASIFVGTLAALAQDNLKRLLAFHTIGQVGYVLLGLGAGIYLMPTHPAIGLLAVMAGMFHLVNHACYKSLLFLNAGSVWFRTGQITFQRVGGMWSIMPLTGVTALIASLSIAGCPPLNGFASKWMIYQVSILGAPGMPVFVVLGVVAVFISLVTLASFLKFMGSAFLGAPLVTPEQARAGDVSWTMQLPQVVLALSCVLFGLAPALPLSGLYHALTPLRSFGGATPSLADLLGRSSLGLQLSFAPGLTTAVWLPIVGLVLLVIMTALAHGLSRLGAAERRTVEVWHCGALSPGEQARYPAHSFYGPFKTAFENVYPKAPVPHAAYPTRLMSVFDLDLWLIQPVLKFCERMVEATRRTHSGIPQLYLSWQIAGAIIVVAVLFFLAR